MGFVPFFEPQHADAPRNHILFGNDPDERFLNPYAETVRGFREFSETQMKVQVKLNQDFDFLTKGLTGWFLFSTERFSFFDARRQYDPFFYNVIPGSFNSADDTFRITPINPEEGTTFLNYVSNPLDRSTRFNNYFEFAINYVRTFNEKHDVTANLIATRRSAERPITRQEVEDGVDELSITLPRRNVNLAGRLTYGYDGKYFAEFNFGYNASERFAVANRWGFFPSFGVGYTISNENFWDNSFLSKVFTTMKLRATHGLSGTDAIGNQSDRFFYLSQVNLIDPARGYAWGEFGAVNSPGVSIFRYPNENITWEESTKTNYGIETDIFKDFKLQVDYFTEKRENILQERVNTPVTQGLLSTPVANVGIVKGHGVDASLDFNKTWPNGTWLSLRGNFTFARSEIVFREDIDRSETPWLDRTGQSAAQSYGYVAERLFIDQADVDNSPVQTFGPYGAGDIKYKDINNDGVIGFDDQVPIGNPTTPEIIYGFGFSGGLKNWDLSAFFQGLANESFFIDVSSTPDSPDHINPFVRNRDGKNALLQVIADDHWSLSNQDPKAFWPRLTDELRPNNTQTSTWWMRDGAFLRLKQLELGYTIPEDASKKIGITNARIYVTGTNLFAFSGFKLWDPEQAGNAFGYPIQKVFNLGVQLGF